MTKPTKWLCAQWKLRSVWAPAQSDQSPLSTWRKLGSLATHWAHCEDSDAQADLSLCWAHNHFGFVMLQLICNLTSFHTTRWWELFYFYELEMLLLVFQQDAYVFYFCWILYSRYVCSITFNNFCHIMSDQFYSAPSWKRHAPDTGHNIALITLSWRCITHSYLYPVNLSAKGGDYI